MITYRILPEKPEELFFALGHPTRVGIIECLARHGPMTATQIATQITTRIKAISLPAMLKHIKILERNGIVVHSKQGRLHCIEIKSRIIEKMIEWLAVQGCSWQASMDKMAVDNARRNVS